MVLKTIDGRVIDQLTEEEVKDMIDTETHSSYKASGSCMFKDLPALNEELVNHVYNVTDNFTTTANFLEGAGIDAPAGSNVAIIKHEDELWYDLLGTESHEYASDAEVQDMIDNIYKNKS